jgi:glutamate--cysteine ligase
LLTRRLEWLSEPGNAARIRNGLRGIEKETLRITSDGSLAANPHPRALGSKLTHPSITTDYSEAMLELVTPPEPTSWATLQHLCDIHTFVHHRLEQDLLWPMSMPCALGDDASIPIADYGPSNQGLLRSIYRRGLGYRYGRSMQAIAGVHFNYSPPTTLWPMLAVLEGVDEELQTFKSNALMGLARNYRRQAWLVIYLFGASPAFSRSFLPDGSPLVRRLDRDSWYAPYATSLRMSDLGYQNKNQARLEISLNSIEDYVAGLSRAVTTPEPRYERIGVCVDGEYRQLSPNVLQIENEYYSTIRPKPKKTAQRTTQALRQHGVEYVEIRTLDVNPSDPVGINQRQLRFLELLALYCLLAESPPIEANEQREIDARNLLVAREGRRPGLAVPHQGAQRTLGAIAAAVSRDLEVIAMLLDEGHDAYRTALAELTAMLAHPELTPSARLLDAMRDADLSFEEYGLDVARRHREYFRTLELEPNKERAMEHEVENSWQAAHTLEADNSLSFQEFLDDFLARA